MSAMLLHNTTQELARRCRSFIAFHHREHTALDVKAIAMSLPGELRHQVAASMRWVNSYEGGGTFQPGLLHRVPFFYGLDQHSPPFATIFCPLSSMLTSPNMTIYMSWGSSPDCIMLSLSPGPASRDSGNKLPVLKSGTDAKHNVFFW